MQVGGTVMARNLMGGPTVLSTDPRSTHEVIWEGRGDPGGGDVQYIPEEMLKVPAFARALHRGVIELVNPEDNPEAVRALQRQVDMFRSQQERVRDDAMASIEIETNRDLITLACIGPSSKGQGTCGEAVPVPEKTKFDKPPLCHRHADLAVQFVPISTGQDEGAHREVTWVHGRIDPREQGTQV